MNRLIPCIVLWLSMTGCGGEKSSNVLHFANADVYEIHLKENAVDPAWSPDGGKIVYVWESDLWSITPKGAEDTRLTSLSGQEVYPNWSPVAGSSEIVFVNNAGPEEFTIYTLDPQDGEPKMVATFDIQITSTSFSSDGSEIIFLQYGKNGIFKLPSGGGEVSMIQNSQSWQNVTFAQACPRRGVVTYAERKGNDFSIKSIDIDGGDPTDIISFAGSGQYPTALAESYDGSSLAVALQTDIWQRNIFSVPAAGGTTTAITEFPSDSFHPNNPSWSADGGRIVIQMPIGLYMIELK